MVLASDLLGEVLSKTKACDDVEDVHSSLDPKATHMTLTGGIHSVLYTTEKGAPTHETASITNSTRFI